MLNSAKIDEAWQELGDDELWARVQSKQRWFVTADKEFADLRRYPPGNYAGLILLRASDESRARYLSQLRLQHTLKANPDATAVPLGADRSLSFRPGFPLKQLNGLFACCHNAIHEIKKRGEYAFDDFLEVPEPASGEFRSTSLPMIGKQPVAGDTD